MLNMMSVKKPTSLSSGQTGQGRAWQRKDFAARAFLRLLLASLLLGAAAGAGADSQSLPSLQKAAQEFLSQQLLSVAQTDEVKISIGRLDPRLQLGACEQAVEPFLPSGARLQGKLSVGIRCPGDKPWTVYLPASIQIFAEVMTASHPLSRNQVIATSDLMPQRLELSKLRGGYYRSAEEVVGKILTNTLPAGRALTPNVLRAPLLVRRGDDVTILASTGGLQVRSKGKALQDAARGEHISVRNVRSKRIVEGVAISPGIIQVHM